MTVNSLNHERWFSEQNFLRKNKYLTKQTIMANPAMNEETFTPALGGENTMTIEGTINKSIILIGITILSAVLTWMYVDISILAPYLLPIII